MDKEPSVVTITKGTAGFPEVGQLKVGDSMNWNVKITAIDDNGLSAEVVSAEPVEEAAPDNAEPEGGTSAETPPPTENAQADYVSSRKKGMMKSME